MRWNTDYQRVLPRDLFNEAALLKCLGKVALWIHEGMLPLLTVEHTPVGAGDEHTQGFDVRLTECGYLFAGSLRFYLCGRLADSLGLSVPHLSRLRSGMQPWTKEVLFVSPYNSREPWPLLWCWSCDGDMLPVFAYDGEPDPDFLKAMRTPPATTEVNDALLTFLEGDSDG